MPGRNKESGTLKPRKRRWPMIAGISIGGVIGVLAIMVSLIPSIVSSSMVRNKIIYSLQSSLNRTVEIDDINMSWSGGLDIKTIHIKEIDGFPGDTFIRVNRILCDIDFIPLIKRQIRINNLIIDSPEIVLQRGREGIYNYEDVARPVEPISPPATVEKPPGKPRHTPMVVPAFLSDIRIKAEIINGKFTFVDNLLQEETIIRDLNTTLSIDSLNKPIELKSDFDIEAKDETEHADIYLNVTLAKDGVINPRYASGAFNMKTGFSQIAADFDMARFMGEGGTGLDFSMNIDLKKLTGKLAGILGLPEGMQIEGVIHSKINAEGQIEKIIGIDGKTEITNLIISGGPLGNKPIRQSSINLIQAAGIDIPNDKITVHKIGIESGFAEMFLAGMARDLRNTRNIDFKIFLNLDITKLMSEIGGLLPEGIEVAGSLQSNINLKGLQDRLRAEGKTEIKDLFAKMGGIGPVKEPDIQIQHDITYDLKYNNIEFKDISINTSAGELKSSGTLSKSREIDFNMLLVSNIEKLTQNLQGIVSLPQDLNIIGKIASEINAKGSIEDELRLNGKTILSGINATGGPLGNNSISDLGLEVIHKLDYKITEDSVDIEQMDIVSDFLSMRSKGGIAGLSREMNIDYEVSMNMDLDKTSAQFAGVFPADVNMLGMGIVDIGINGKLPAGENGKLPGWYEQMNLNGKVSIDKIVYDAYEITDFKSRLFLEDGFFTTKGFTFNLNEGPGTLSASANLRDEKPPLVLDMKLSDVNINQNMDLLAYIVPVLAAPEGKVSGKLNMTISAKGSGLNWQEDLSKTLNALGEIDIREGYIKGGKITSEILNTLGKGGEYKFDNVTARFEVKDSAIYSDDISINGEDLNIGLSGWTSFDGRIEYSADAELLSKFAGRDANKILGRMGKDSKLPIVVTGTVNKPKLAFKWPDPQEIGGILQGLLEDSGVSKKQTEGTVEPAREEPKEEEKVLKKLFKELFK